MGLKTVAFLIVLSLFCSCASADEISHRAAAEELLFLTNKDEALKPMYKQIEKMMEQQFLQLGASEELRPVLNKYTSKMLKVMKEELDWTKSKNDYIDIYVKTYTEEEMRAISEFYKSPAGEKFLEKMPQILQESMAILQRNMSSVVEKMQGISAEMTAEIKQLQAQ